MLEFLVA